MRIFSIPLRLIIDTILFIIRQEFVSFNVDFRKLASENFKFPFFKIAIDCFIDFTFRYVELC